MRQRVKVAFVGCGTICVRNYLPTALERSDAIEVVAVCDASPGRAAAVAEQHGIPEHYEDYGELLSRSEAELVVNLTPAQLHYAVSLAALESARHVYVEKPMARTLGEANRLIDAARARGVQLMAAPTVMMNPLNVKLRELVREGAIGKVAFANAHSVQAGPAIWVRSDLPDPSWFYQKGGGPLYDIGVYQLTAVTGILGPARRVSALSGILTPERTITSGEAAGKTIAVDEDDNTVLLLDFGGAAFAHVSASWHGRGPSAAAIELVGQTGTIQVQGGTIWLHDGQARREIPFEGPAWSIPIGLPHLADCLLRGEPPAIPVEHARHVVEIMEKALVAARTGETQVLTTEFGQS